jgi:NitT/TauT family transport system permease protein
VSARARLQESSPSGSAAASVAEKVPSSPGPSDDARGRRRWRFVRPVSGTVVFLAVWQIGALIYRDRSPGSADSKLPIPTKVLSALVDKHAIYTDALGVTAKGTLIGLAVGIAIGVVIACASVASGVVESIIYPYLVASQMVPTIILAPIILAVVQDAEVARILAAAYISFFVIALNMTKGLKSVDPDQLILLRSVNARPWQSYTKLRLPASLPHFFVGLKIAAPLSVVGEVTIELTGAQNGLGTLSLTSLKYGNDQIYTFWGAVTLIAVLGYVMFLAACLVERITTPWQPEFRKAA